MQPKYHASTVTGKVDICEATVRRCRFPNFSSPEAAGVYLAEMLLVSSPAVTVPQGSSFLGKYSEGVGELFYPKDNWGDTEQLEGGVLTDEVKTLFMQGQCLGLAVELAQALGTNRIAVTTFRDMGDDVLWDEDKDEPILDEYGDEIMETYENIFHAYAVDASGELWDIRGKHSLKLLAKDYESVVPAGTPYGDVTRNRILVGSIEELGSKFHNFMPEQDMGFAKTFVLKVLPKKLVVS